MKGGAYNGELRVNKNIFEIIKTDKYDNDKTLIFMIRNLETNELTNYNNIQFLGKGTYGKIFLVLNDTDIKFIIDYGLSILFPITVDDMTTIILGNIQISIDIIIAYLLKVMYDNSSNNSNNNNNTNNKINSILKKLYNDYIDDVQKTIDNFRLFWIIISSISIKNIFNQYILFSGFIINSKEIKLFEKYLNFYFNLDNTEEAKEFIKKLKPYFNYKNNSNLRQQFIDNVRSNISPEKFRFYFKNNEQLYLNFMEKVLALVRIDPSERISKEELLQDPFFTIIDNTSSEELSNESP